MNQHAIEWHLERARGIGGSEASKVMAGEWLPLWEEKTGRREPDDLTWVLPVQIGTITEALNRAWFAHHTGIVVSTEGCEHLTHPEHGFMRANLDGLCEGAIFEAKHVSAFAKPEEIVTRYFPQLQHNMAVAGLRLAHLSVFYGNHKWEPYEVEADPDYQSDLIEREAEFWRHVEMDLQPEDQDSKAVAIALDDMREVEMTGHNAWASHAGAWLDNKDAAKAFKDADKEIKALVEDDVKLAFGHGIKATRAKNGAITIRSA